MAGTNERSGGSSDDAPRPKLGRVPRPLIRWAPALLIGLVLGIGLTLVVQLLTSGDSDGLPDFTSAPLPDSPDVTVTLSYELMSALIQRGIDTGETPVPLTNISSGNRNGRLLIRGNFSVLGQTVSGSVELEPYVEDGQLRMFVRRAQLGRLPVPANLDRLAEGPLNRQLAAALGDLPATVTGVLVHDHGITITADVRIDEIPVTPR